MNHKITNYHTHTWRCHHAYGTDEEFVLEAIRNGYSVLGFSDHACWKYDSNFKSHMRMTVSEFKDYKNSVQILKRKYKNKIDIQMGMEAEFFPRYQDWLLKFCIDQEVDYLILGNHYFKTDELHLYFGNIASEYISDYFDSIVEGLKTGMYSYLAHPELILRNRYLRWDDKIEKQFRRICNVCKELDIPLEYNVLGMQMNEKMGYISYPHPEFWKLAKECGCKAIIGMDAHKVSDLDKNLYYKARQNLETLGIEIVTEIKKVDFRKLLNERS